MSAACCCQSTSTPCGCCEGLEPLTPLSTVNRPGLPALSYRIGTHSTFLETMKARALMTGRHHNPRSTLFGFAA